MMISSAAFFILSATAAEGTGEFADSWGKTWYLM
jgi:hypothetical protein